MLISLDICIMLARGKNSWLLGQPLIVFMVCAVTTATSEVTPSPNIGDLKLVLWDTNQMLYEVNIYYSDGTVEPKWGAICNDISSINEAKVICNQVGKVLSIPNDHAFGGRPTGTPVWLKGVSCDSSELHLLRCKYSVIPKGMDDQTTCGPHGERLVVKCDDEDITQDLHYNGHIKLCPPDSLIKNDSTSNTITSISLGVVSLFLNKQWRGINQQATGGPFGGNEADAICRQMGYTHSVGGSALVKEASGYTFNECYTSTQWPHALHHNAWITTHSIKCRDQTQQKCFGCCYDYASAVFPNGCATCNSSYDLTISCSFDPVKAILNTGTQGNANDCKLQSNNAVSTCYSEPNTYNPAVPALATLFSISLAILVLCGFIKCVGGCRDSKGGGGGDRRKGGGGGGGDREGGGGGDSEGEKRKLINGDGKSN